MGKKSTTDKVLIVLEGLIEETASVIYPYKGIGRSFRSFKGSLSKAIYEVARRGYLERIEIDGEKFLKMTAKGRLKLIRKQITGSWDGYWRIVAFDIEEERKKTRDAFRNKLIELGCRPIQKSVWITPNDISDSLEKLLEILDLKNNVDYFLSQALTNEDKYCSMFDIKEQH